MRGWIFVGLITGVIFGGAAAMVAWIFAMPMNVTFRVVGLAIPLGIALEWVTVRGKGVGFPVAFLVIGGLAFLLYLQVREVSSGPRFVRGPATPEASATAPAGGGGGGGRTGTGTGTASGGGARVVEPGRAEADGGGADAPAVSTEPAVLAIRNPTDQTLRLWIIDSGGRSRLGRLRAGRTREVRIRAREPSVVIEVRGSGGGYTMPVGVAPGATLSVDLVPPG
jgi:hypothetical protein